MNKSDFVNVRDRCWFFYKQQKDKKFKNVCMNVGDWPRQHPMCFLARALYVGTPLTGHTSHCPAEHLTV